MLVLDTSLQIQERKMYPGKNKNLPGIGGGIPVGGTGGGIIGGGPDEGGGIGAPIGGGTGGGSDVGAVDDGGTPEKEKMKI